MRIIFLLSALMLAVSCGKDGDSNGLKQSQEIPDLVWDGQPVDTQEVMVSAHVNVSGSSIHFSKPVGDTKSGHRVSCSIQVGENEVYHYRVHGNRLTLQTNSDTVDYQCTSSCSGPTGNWFWEGQRNGVYEHRNIYIAKNLKEMVLRKNCSSH